MSHNYFTPYKDKTGSDPGTTFIAEDMNAPLEQLDSQVKTNTDAIANHTTQISGKADSTHDHDDRYYTKTELGVDTSGVEIDYANLINVPEAGPGAGDTIAPGTHAADYVPQWNSTPNSKTLVEGFPITTAGKAILDDADVAAQRATLGVDGVIGVVAYESIQKPGDGAEVSAFPPPLTFAAGLTGWTYYSPTAPTTQQVVSIRKNGVEFGTLTIATDNTYIFASTSGVSFNGTTDRLSFVFPTPQDATWKGVTIGMKGVRS